MCHVRRCAEREAAAEPFESFIVCAFAYPVR
jgi:hypothetical protein